MASITGSLGSSSGSSQQEVAVPQARRQAAVDRLREMRLSFANRSEDENVAEVAREFGITSDDLIGWAAGYEEEELPAAAAAGVSAERRQDAVDRFIELRLTHARRSDEENAATVVEEFNNQFDADDVIVWTSEYELAPRLPAGVRPGDVAPAGAALASSLVSTGDEKKDDMKDSE